MAVIVVCYNVMYDEWKKAGEQDMRNNVSKKR